MSISRAKGLKLHYTVSHHYTMCYSFLPTLVLHATAAFSRRSWKKSWNAVL